MLQLVFAVQGAAGFRTVKDGPRLAGRHPLRKPPSEVISPHRHQALSQCSCEPLQSIQPLSAEGSLSRQQHPPPVYGVVWGDQCCGILGVTLCSLDAASQSLLRRLSRQRELLGAVLCGSERGG